MNWRHRTIKGAMLCPALKRIVRWDGAFLFAANMGRVGVHVLDGYDDKPGWLTNVKGKPLAYGLLADAVRDGACTVRSSETAAQLASIEASTLSAPEGLKDDMAMAYCLAVAALAWRGKVEVSEVAQGVDVVAEFDRGRW